MEEAILTVKAIEFKKQIFKYTEIEHDSRKLRLRRTRKRSAEKNETILSVVREAVFA